MLNVNNFRFYCSSIQQLNITISMLLPQNAKNQYPKTILTSLIKTNHFPNKTHLVVQLLHPLSSKLASCCVLEPSLIWYLATILINLIYLNFELIMSSHKSVTLKYLVVGDSGVGKTSLLVRYCEDTFQTDYLSTIGVDFKIKRADHNGCQVTLNIWDTAGQERFRNITKSFYKGAHGIILAYSITDPNSYAHIENWVDQIRQVGNQQTDMILVATKSDMDNDRKVTRKQGEALAEKYNIKLIESSAKNNENVGKVFEELTEGIVTRYEAENKLQESKEISNTALGKKKQESKKGDCC